LYLNRVTRVHEDVDIVVLEKHRRELQIFLLETVYRGSLHTTKQVPHFDIYTLESDGDSCFLKEDKTISLPLAKIGYCNAGDIPFLAPEAVLILKARNTSPKDEQDFSNVINHISASNRLWLKQVMLTCYPDHHWNEKL